MRCPFQKHEAEDATHWLKRDMWVACDGSLCYFSIKENKRLVLLDGIKMAGPRVLQINRAGCLWKSRKPQALLNPKPSSGAKVTSLPSSARDFAFRLDCINSDDHEKDITMCLCVLGFCA